MPHLDWESFNTLPGSRERNFETLCRGLVRLHFGSFGKFAALKNQPGVEFHLKLTKTCTPLGDPPRWYGWQCKSHLPTKSGDLRAASKKDIEDSLKKTEQNVLGLTDWVLWTPYILSRKDQTWFDNLRTPYTLHQWAGEEIENYLSGPALNLRSAYFGELIATPEELENRHREAIQPIRDRWLEAVHQQVDAERTIRRMLGEPGSWDRMTSVGKRLKAAADVISLDQDGTDRELANAVASFVNACAAVANTLLNFHRVLADGDLDLIQQDLRERTRSIDGQVLSTPGRLRDLNLPVALDATNALDDIRIAQEILDEVEEYLGVGLVALLADAGGGKTQTAAELTAAQGTRPAGVLLHGRNLKKGQTLDQLASTLSLNGSPLTSMERLLAAIDAAGKRAGCRLPVAIDGLSEAENARDWKAPLASLGETIKRYPNVLVVCTLRTGEHRREEYRGRRRTQPESRESFAVMALPDKVKRIPSEGFGKDTSEAIQKYFNHFKIDPGDAEIPMDFLQHPLTLRIFCEVTNPHRATSVRIDDFPSSLASLFEKYVENACERISQMPNLNCSYTAEDVGHSIYTLGLQLWSAGRREIDEQSFRQAIADAGRDWTSSIVNLLAQEGIIFRNPGREPYSYVITPVYDALGGFIVASSLLKKHSNDREFKWLKEPTSLQQFHGENTHELAMDTFWSLVALAPRRMYRTQIWRVAPEVLCRGALRFATTLDPEYLDLDTVAAIRDIMSKDPKGETRLLFQFQKVRAVADHPLNADFLDSVLRAMGIAERDLSWTEWVRKSRDERLLDLFTVEGKWKENLFDRTRSDRLRARWIKWFLTSTDRELRDVATRALYWFGRGAPSALFEDTIDSLDINDPYIQERMLAASYGVAMALCSGSEETGFKDKTLPNYARRLYECLFAKQAPFSTTHALVREYTMRTIELAASCSPSVFSPEELERSRPPFSDGGLRQWGESETGNSREELRGADSPFHMDFENYTLGTLVPGRGNYDYRHEGYRKIRSQVLWRVEQLGWTGALFKATDSEIAGEQYRPRGRRKATKTERYGKKYSWIAYYEMAGLQSDLGLIGQGSQRDDGIWVADIDPSFPNPPVNSRVIEANLIGNSSLRTEQWIMSGPLPDVNPFLQLPILLTEYGPWVMLHGFAVQEDEELGRHSFCHIHSFFVPTQDADSFAEYFNQRAPGEWDLPRLPTTDQTFAGEIPWCSTYAANGIVDFGHQRAVIPVCDVHWKSYQAGMQETGRVVTVAKEVAAALDLTGQPQSFDLLTRNGLTATRFISDQGDDYSNGQSVCYIREELLQAYLKREDYALVWVIWGERRYSSKLFRYLLQGQGRSVQPYKYFGSVEQYR